MKRENEMGSSVNNRNQRPIIKPSDAVSWVSCVRRVWLDNNLSEGPEDELAGFDQLVAQLGNIHEQSILAKLTTRHQVETAQSVEHTPVYDCLLYTSPSPRDS